MKLTIKFYLVLCVESIRTRNQDPRPFPNSLQCHESNGGLRIDEQTSVENIFRGKHYCLGLHEIQYLDIRDFILETNDIPGHMLTSRV